MRRSRRTAAAGSLALFVAFFCIILSMYGGGFATVPAYLADMFGTQMVGAIHGRLLTAWSTAGVLGPVLVNYIREYQLEHGVARADAYTVTMYILAGLLVLGAVCNWLVKSVAEQHYMDDAELREEKKLRRRHPPALRRRTWKHWRKKPAIPARYSWPGPPSGFPSPGASG